MRRNRSDGRRSPPRIVILGGGFAGVATAQRLEHRLRPHEAEIILVSRDNYSLFTPMLPEVSSGNLETRHIVTPIRAELRRTRFVLAEVERIDLAARTVRVCHSISGTHSELGYDQLAIALGSVTSTFNLPGVAENSLPLKTLEDAETLRNHVIATLELADVTTDPAERRRLLTYAIVGGGYTGVEAAGELLDFFASITRFYRTVAPSEIRLVLVEAGARLLPELPERMAEYTRSLLTRRGVDVILGVPVEAADAHYLRLGDGRRIDCRTIVWSAGARPSPLLRELPVPRARSGALEVREDLSVPGHPGVWALGDCAAVPNGQGGTYPPTAQHAIREGPLVADNIVATLRGRRTRPFRYASLGSMASLGARSGVAALPGGRVLTGFPAWVVWRMYYLSRLPGIDRKIRVAFDWTLGLIFPRDIAELRVFTERARTGACRDAGMPPLPIGGDGTLRAAPTPDRTASPALAPDAPIAEVSAGH